MDEQDAPKPAKRAPPKGTPVAAPVEGGALPEATLVEPEEKPRRARRATGMLSRRAGAGAEGAGGVGVFHVAAIVGLALTLVGRGGQSISEKSAARTQARATLARANFQRKWDAKIANEKDSAARAKLLAQKAEQEQKQRKTWAHLIANAATAAANDAVSQYYLQWVLILGALVLALGAAGVALTREGVERWGSLLVLAIVLLGL